MKARIVDPSYPLDGVLVETVAMRADGMVECLLLESSAEYQAGDTVYCFVDCVELAE